MLNRILSLLFVVLLLASCSENTNPTMSYEEVKKMVIDSVQTEDGKKAIRQLLEDPSFRELIVLEHDEIEASINDTLLSKDAEEFWKKTYADPKFKEAMAKSMKEQQTEIMKDLIKNSSYQEDLIKFFGQEEMQKEFATILKSKDMRKQMEEVVKETLQDPILQTQWVEIIKKSGESGSSGEEKKGESGGGGESGSGGEGSEGGGS
ncbi:spore germination lipoprotein GerD [Lysinibacillus sp. BW-2-10]|uniref:spore germination lipoprotein GerD n=1 Tax=Lysinibacillus sp. BW-2-10 TaxID=2590030 RepID=UPI002108306E|nr:spore germination lipoprotein GerD [Lysinibacillus sp. BW-2-10]